ncbi:MAG: ribosomal protein large subunit ribosomal protein [Candidatus Kaiserbacteria bacterium]|nr:ribosomal protein large subunit ribosomal protein [Candidatus Kaiserbacteria bacterium]
MKAILKNYHQAPRKVRLVADLIRGKQVPAAHVALTFLPKKVSPVMFTLLNSAVANARQAGYEPTDLFVKKITVDKGLVLKRVRPFKQGRAGQLRHIMSHIVLELGTNAGAVPVATDSTTKTVSDTKPAAKKVAKKTAKKTTKKVASKTT